MTTDVPTTNAMDEPCVRALHVFGSLNRGGAETWLMDVMRHASRGALALDVCLIGAGAGAYEEEFRDLGGRIFRCPLGRSPWRFSRAFLRLLKSERFTVVHSHVYLFSGVVLRAAAQAGVPRRIAHIHPVEDVKARRLFRSIYATWMKRWIVRYGTHFVAPTRDGLDSYWGAGWESDGNKSVLYNGVDVARFAAPSDGAGVRRELGLDPGTRIVLNVARFTAHKRHIFLVDVAERLLKRDPDVCFVCIGAGALREQVMALTTQKDIDSRFRFVSGAPSIDRYWLAADAFAFPSSNEGFGIVIAEAAAAGLPVVAQDIPGVREAARAGHDVALLPLETEPEPWSRALEAALQRGRLDEQARQRHLNGFPFTIAQSVAALRTLYGIPPTPRDDTPHDYPPS